MRYQQFENKLINLPAFNLNDIRKADPNFYRQQLNFWRRQGNIIPLIGGYYTFSNRIIDEAFLFMLANKIYEPSYVSLESALAFYQVIPETVMGVTSTSSRKTQQFESTWGNFSYRSIKPILMIGYDVLKGLNESKFKIAQLEKAILDFLYLHHEIKATEDIEGLRWNKDYLQGALDIKILLQYAAIYNKKALFCRIEIFQEYLNA